MNIQNYITKSHELNWERLIENGIHYHGVFVKSLHYDQVTQRSTAILLRFEKGASYPYHIHPAGEEILVLQGSCEIHKTSLNRGDYLFTPPGGKHSVKSEDGCILFLSIPEEVIIIAEDE